MAKGVSLHIGLNAVDPTHYQGWSGPLTACEADAEDMEAIAAGRGFVTTRLATKQATRGAVIGALRKASGELVPGDLLLLTYSGHGGQIPDSNQDEPDGLDETWCLYDGELIDDELHGLFAEFKPGVRIVMLSDSCHSGTVAREAFYAAMRSSGTLAMMTGGASGPAPAVRQIPPEVALRVYRKHTAFYTALQAAIAPNVRQQVRASVVLISGCQDNQYSSDGPYNGLFTANLLRVWNKGLFAGGYPALHTAIVARMPPVQTPNYFRVGPTDAAFEAQVPFTI